MIPMIEILEVEGLARVFVGGRGISGVSMTVARGEKVALVGPNGAGKTTLLRLVAGVLRPDEGAIRRAPDLVVRDLPPREPVSDALPLGANRRLLAGATASATPSPSPFDRLNEAGAGRLSSGERRRALLAWGLAQGADLLLLDEPSAHLDAAGRADLSRRLAEHSAAMIVATHDEDLLPGARRVRLAAGWVAP